MDYFRNTSESLMSYSKDDIDNSSNEESTNVTTTNNNQIKRSRKKTDNIDMYVVKDDESVNSDESDSYQTHFTQRTIVNDEFESHPSSIRKPSFYNRFVSSL